MYIYIYIYTGFFLLAGIKGEFPLPAKNLLIPPPKKIPPSSIPPTKFLCPPPLSNNFQVITQ